MKRVLILLTTLLSLMISITLAQNLPDLGDRYNSTAATLEEQKLHDIFLQAIRAHAKLLNDPIVNEYIAHLGFKLAAHSTRASLDYQFLIIQDNSINAFSGPCGIIGINSGLILKSRTEGELASVLAHEIAHTAQRHILRNIAKQKQMQLPNIAALIAAAAISIVNPQAAAGLIAAGTAGSYQYMLTYSRRFEKEADRIGMQILAKAGYNPFDMPKFFLRLAREMRYEERIPEFLASHPDINARFADAYNRSERYKTIKDKKSAIFPLIQARVLSQTTSNPTELATRAETRLKKHPNNIKLRYIYTLALIQLDNLPLATQQMNKLLKTDPNMLMFKLTKADIDLRLGLKNKAQSSLSHLYEYYPDYYPIVLQYAQTLLKNKEPRQALTLLEEHEETYDQNISFLDLLSEAQAKNNQTAQSYLTRAKVFLLNGNNRTALSQLEMAKRYAKHNPLLRAKINGLLKMIQSSMVM